MLSVQTITPPLDRLVTLGRSMTETNQEIKEMFHGIDMGDNHEVVTTEGDCNEVPHIVDDGLQ